MNPHPGPSRSGQALLEYAVAAAALLLAALAAAALVGAKVGGLIALTLDAAPGSHPTDNGPYRANPVVELTEPSPGNRITLDLDAIEAGSNTSRLGETFGDGPGSLDDLVLPPEFEGGSP